MIKKAVLLIFLTSTFILTSCLFRGRIVYVGEERAAKERIQEILAAIKDKDKEAMKALFSKKALEEAYNGKRNSDKKMVFFKVDLV